MSLVADIEPPEPLERVRERRSWHARSRSQSFGFGRSAACAALALAFGSAIPASWPAQAQQAYQYQPPPQSTSGYPAAPAYPAPPAYPPPPGYAEPPAPPPPPGAVWVGAPGQCLYGNGMVYWCAPGVVFDGFPPGWDFAAYPVFSFGPEIIVDPIWFGGWRVGHPGFAFRGRLASEGERAAFAAHRQDIIRNSAIRANDHPAPRPGRPEDRR